MFFSHHTSRITLHALRFYVIIDKFLIGRKKELEVASKVIDGGATAIQLRDKYSSTSHLIKVGLKIRKLTKNKSGLFT